MNRGRSSGARAPRRLAPAAGLPPAGAAAQVRRSHRCRRSSLHVDERRSSKVRSYHRTRTRLERRRRARAPCSLLLPPLSRGCAGPRRLYSASRRALFAGLVARVLRSIRGEACATGDAVHARALPSPPCLRTLRVRVDSLQPHSSAVSYTPPYRTIKPVIHKTGVGNAKY